MACKSVCVAIRKRSKHAGKGRNDAFVRRTYHLCQNGLIGIITRLRIPSGAAHTRETADLELAGLESYIFPNGASDANTEGVVIR